MADSVKKYSVQIIDNGSVKEQAKETYPNLYREVYEHDAFSMSSWYDLSKDAYKEFSKFKRLMRQKGIW